MEFRTQYDRLEKPIYSNPGSEWHTNHRAKFDKNGDYSLFPDETVNTQEMIESFRDSVDLNLILQRYANGDTSALNKVQGTYGDFTGLPTNIIEAMNFFNDGKDQFNQLPLDVREKFGFNFGRYLAEFGSEEWSKKMGFIDKPVDDKPVDVQKGENE